MRPMQTSQTGVGSVIMPVDHNYESFLVTVDATGTVNFTVNLTNVNVLKGDTPLWFPITDLTSKAVDTVSQTVGGVTAFQLVVNSGTGTATMTVTSAGGGSV